MDSIFQEPSGRHLVAALSENLAAHDYRQQPVKGVFTLIVHNQNPTAVSYLVRVTPGHEVELATMLKAAVRVDIPERTKATDQSKRLRKAQTAEIER